jgi:hypothetical protein
MSQTVRKDPRRLDIGFKGAVITYSRRLHHSTKDNLFFFGRVISPSVLSCLLFPFRAEEAADPAIASLLKGAEGSSTPAGFMNALLVDAAADGVRSVCDEWRSTPTLLLSYITRLAGSLSFFDDLETGMPMLDIDLILVFRVSSG